MRRLPKNIARKGPQVNAPSLYASAVPKSTGTAAAVRLNGLASRNHSARTCRLVKFIVRPIVESVVGVCNRFVHGSLGFRCQLSGRFARGVSAGFSGGAERDRNAARLHFPRTQT